MRSDDYEWSIVEVKLRRQLGMASGDLQIVLVVFGRWEAEVENGG